MNDNEDTVHPVQRHNHQHRPPLRLSVPSRIPSSRFYPTPPLSSSSPPFLFSPSSTPTPTPSKRRSSFYYGSSAINSTTPTTTSIFFLLFSLRSLYSLLPFLRSSSPSFSLFPFSFLVSLLSFFLSVSFSLFSSSSIEPHRHSYSSISSLFSSSTPTPSLLRPLFAKSSLLALVFLLRFQALRSCGTAATILADFSGCAAAKFITEHRSLMPATRARALRGFLALLVGMCLLSLSWDRINCFPLSSSSSSLSSDSSSGNGGNENCVRFMPMFLPFLSGFLGFFERSSSNWGSLKQLGRKRVRLISLFLTTLMLFVPAVISFFAIEEDRISLKNLGWPLVNTVVFGVILSENYGDDKVVFARDLQKDFLVTLFCTLVLELFYFPELSLVGFLFCGLLLWFSVRELGYSSLNYPELGSGSSQSLSSMIAKPIRHILSERKSRKIALFLLINTGYMVVEFVAGFMSNSLGLISDACHMLFDCAALAIGLYASYISRLPVSNQFNYGRGRFEVLSGYVNAVLLVLVGALIVLESFERILDPQEISTSSLLIVSIGGLVVNVVGLIFFHEEHHHAHGSCSHSHHDHHHHNHHHHRDSHEHVGHNHKHHHEHHKSIVVHHEASHGKSDDVHDPSFCYHDHQRKEEDVLVGAIKKYDAYPSSYGHDYHDHRENHGEEQNLLSHHHQGHCDQHLHDDSHDHQSHRCHGHQNDHRCHDHEHSHHAHTGHFLNGSNEVEHSHENPTHSSRSPRNACRGGHAHDGSQALTDTHCCHKNMLNSSHISNTVVNSNLCDDSSEAKMHKEPQKHRHIDHNMEGIFLHVLADTLGSVGVVISTLLIKYKGWLVADPACSIFISVLIISSVISLLRNSAEILLQRVPRSHEQDLEVAMGDVMNIKGVCGIQNMHVWSFTNTDVVGTLHLHISAEADRDSCKEQVSHILQDAGINDLTLQVECVGGR